MKAFLQYSKYIACFLFGSILAWNLKCCPTCPELPKEQGHIVSVTHVVHDSIPFEKQVPVPYLVAVHDTFKYPVVHDTTKVFKDYFATKSYLDTLANDSNLFALYKFNVFRNAATAGNFEYKIRRAIAYQTNTTTPPESAKNKVFIGIGLNGSTDKFGASLQGALLTKHDALFGAGYDFLNKEINVSAYIKIHL